MNAHLQLDGTWTNCRSRRCALPYHVPLPAEEAAAIPQVTLYPLMEILDPPKIDRDGVKLWLNKLRYSHRDYDLPAKIFATGQMEWSQHGRVSRAGDRPAIVLPDGEMHWRERGEKHRLGGPAIIYPDGAREWHWHDLLIATQDAAGDFFVEDIIRWDVYYERPMEEAYAASR